MLIPRLAGFELTARFGLASRSHGMSQRSRKLFNLTFAQTILNECSRKYDSGQSRHGRRRGKSGQVGDASESGSKFRALAASLEAGAGAALDVIQASKPEPRIVRCEFSEHEWNAIKRCCRTTGASFGG
jgi:hypothetical protein